MSDSKAAEVAAQFPGWHVWVTREGGSVVATRTGATASREPRTLICDDWASLERELAEQAADDLARA